MLREKIEEMTGGKEYIKVCVSLGVVITIPLATLLGIGLGIAMEEGIMVTESIIIALMVILVVPIVGMTEYYYRVNKIDNVYMKSVKSIV